MAKILVIRFSAIGDVAMTIPVIYSFAVRYPEHEITVLSRMGLKPLFLTMPPNVSFVGADFSKTHHGITGINKLYCELRRNCYDYIADFHDVLRTKYLRFRFRLDGKKVACIDKGRNEKKALSRKRDKVFSPLKSSFQRYADVLHGLGFEFPMEFTSVYPEGRGDFSLIEPVVGMKGDTKWIGIAPFARHIGKIYPIEQQKKVIAHFAQRSDVRLFLFGGGRAEQDVFDRWVKEFPILTSLVGKMNLQAELILISYLDVMFSMDSANMHLASLVNTPVVSVWGATHPYAGFMGWKQSVNYAVQVDMPCRPCSVYGDKPCWRSDYACMSRIEPSLIIEKIESVIDSSMKR